MTKMAVTRRPWLLVMGLVFSTGCSGSPGANDAATRSWYDHGGTTQIFQLQDITSHMVLDAIKPDYPAMLRDCVTVTAAARPFSALPSIPEDRLTLDRAHVELALQEMTDLCSKAKVARSKGDTATMTADLYQAGLRVGDAGHYLSLLEVDGPKTTSKPSP